MDDQDDSGTPEMPAVELRRGRKKGTYLYRQFADSVEQLIREGHFQPGQKLPSMDQLAANFELNKLTVYKALQVLAKRGVIRTVRAQGTFVTGGAGGPAPGAVPSGGSFGGGAGGGANPARPAMLLPAQKTALPVGVVSRVMMPGHTGYYHLMLLDAMRNRLDAFGSGLLMLPTNSLPEEEQIAEVAQRSPVCGIICIGELKRSTLQMLQGRLRVPLLLLDFREIGLPADTICQNNRNGAFLAVEHLLATGRKRIAIICGPDDQRVSQERLEGAFHALRQYGIDAPVCMEKGNFSKQSGNLAMARLLARGVAFDGLFCMNDEMALGALEVARSQGRHAPQDFALVGYDDIPLAGEDIISLSTVRAPVQQMGWLAVEHLMLLRTNPQQVQRTQELMPELVVRRTSSAGAVNPD